MLRHVRRQSRSRTNEFNGVFHSKLFRNVIGDIEATQIETKRLNKYRKQTKVIDID